MLQRIRNSGVSIHGENSKLENRPNVFQYSCGKFQRGH